jgi:integrase
MRAKFAGKAQRTFKVRIRYGVGFAGSPTAMRERFVVLAKNEKARDAKRDRMARMATDLAACGLHKDVKAVLDEAGVAPSDVVLSGIEEMVRGRCAAARAKAESIAAGRQPVWSAKTTFAEVAELLFEKQKQKKNSPHSIGKDRQRLAVLAPRLAKVPIGQLTNKIADEAMMLVPAGVEAGRCLYEGLISRVVKHARRLEIIEGYPLRQDFVSPQPEPKKLFQYLYVEEDLALITGPAPLWRRLGYAIMSRESVRPGFLTHFYYSDRVDPNAKLSSIDLDSGLLTHWHKQKKVRRWPVCERVLRVLRAWRALNPDSDRVLPEWDHRNIATTMRRDLKDAKQNRAALHRTTAAERQIAAKDAGRATFVTLALRGNAPMHWVTDRTGHMTEEMVGRYNRMAREKRDTARAWLRPLDEALGVELGLEPLAERFVVPWLQGLPESEIATPSPWPMAGLAQELGQQLGQLLGMAKELNALGPQNATSYYSKSSSTASQNQPKTATSCTSSNSKAPAGPPQIVGVGQDTEPGGPRCSTATRERAKPKASDASGGNQNLVATSQTALTEDDLLELHALATKAKRWELVEQLSAQLKVLAAASLPNVTSLAAVRKRRDEGGGK